MHLYAQITWVLQCFHFRPDCFQPRPGKNALFLLLLFILLLRLLLPSCQPSVDFHKGVRLFYARARSRLTVHSKTVCGDAQALSVNLQKRKEKQKKEEEQEQEQKTFLPPSQFSVRALFFFFLFICQHRPSGQLQHPLCASCV